MLLTNPSQWHEPMFGGEPNEWATAKVADAVNQLQQTRMALGHAIALTPSGLARVLLTDASIEVDKALDNLGNIPRN